MKREFIYENIRIIINITEEKIIVDSLYGKRKRSNLQSWWQFVYWAKKRTTREKTKIFQ